MDASKYRVAPEPTFSDPDLGDEEFVFPDGSRLTEERAEQLGEEAARRRAADLVPGRTSLSRSGKHPPALSVRLPEELLSELRTAKDVQAVSVSKLARQVLTDWVAARRR